MATGWGTGHRVRQAYRYLLLNYREGDEIYVFGFSRGAYSARILASLIHYGGLPDEPMDEPEEAELTASRIYRSYTGDMEHAARLSAVSAAVGELGMAKPFRSRKITFMGLWDTVAALGTRDRSEEEFGTPSRRYADQLCNVERAMHAVSLDDNRALEFTPILLTRPYLVENCFTDQEGKPRKADRAEMAAMLNRIVEEVWFPGAHSDVGGGYREGRLEGLSLNWMLPELKKKGLVGSTDPIVAHPLDCVHDAQKFMRGHVYKRQSRDVAAYLKDSQYNGGRMKLHPSVISRLWALPGVSETNEWERGSPLGLEQIFGEKCFTRTDSDRYRFTPRADCPLEMSNKLEPVTAAWSRMSTRSRIHCGELALSPY